MFYCQFYPNSYVSHYNMLFCAFNQLHFVPVLVCDLSLLFPLMFAILTSFKIFYKLPPNLWKSVGKMLSTQTNVYGKSPRGRILFFRDVLYLHCNKYQPKCLTQIFQSFRTAIFCVLRYMKSKCNTTLFHSRVRQFSSQNMHN